MFYQEFSFCPKCGSRMVFTTKFNRPIPPCKKCGHEVIVVPYDDEKGPTREDRDKFEKDIIENVIKKHPDYDAELFEKVQKEEEEFWKSVRAKNEPPKEVRCPKCGSTQIQLVNKKWSIWTGFLTNKVDRVCLNCKHKF